ncbi:MAG: hypothetical protein JXR96_30745 [Deltaproteobacteria bacterium]|nr:hypothetical protein [Deltaproteobacteria bacterium]
MKMRWTVALTSCLCLIALACGQGDDGDAGDIQAGWNVGGCAGEQSALTAEGHSDACEPEALLPDVIDYCQETLFWRYEAETGALQLVDAPVSLNCCGLRSVRTSFENGVYVITEVDEPGEYRCRCMCDAIYSVCIAGVAGGRIPVRLVLDVTDDSSGPRVVWEGEIDLDEGQGEIDLGSSSSWNCMD